MKKERSGSFMPCTQRKRGSVEKIVYSGDGLIREEVGIGSSRVTFVPFVAPHETVEYHIHTQKKNYARASLLSVVVPSPDRVSPACAHFGVCGGCQLQHIRSEAHAHIKKGWLEEAVHKLKPYLDSDIEWLSLPPFWQWRKKVSLHASINQKQWTLGYWSHDSSTIVPIHQCPLFLFEEEAVILSDIQALLHEILPPEESDHGLTLPLTLSLLRIEKYAARFSFALHCTFEIDKRGGSFSKGLEKKLKEGLKRLFWVKQASYVIQKHHRTERVNLFGEPCTDIEIDGFSLKAPFRAFMQNHPTMSSEVWKDVVSSVKKTIPAGSSSRVLDLYSGIGVTSLLLAKDGYRVDAVEISRSACAALQETVEKYRLQDRLRVFQSSVEDAFSGRLKDTHKKDESIYHAWLINPPREGASKEVIERLSTGEYGKFGLYTSCNPSTLQRDIQLLVDAGWRIRSIKGYDMFPMTTHFETVAALYR